MQMSFISVIRSFITYGVSLDVFGLQ